MNAPRSRFEDAPESSPAPAVPGRGIEGSFFIGRDALRKRLGALYRSGQHVILTGIEGVGKSLLMETFARHYPMSLASRCGCIGDLLTALEPLVGPPQPEWLGNAARVHRLAAALPALGRPLLLENVQRVPPRVAHFVRYLLPRQPVWLVARSIRPLELGHVWPYLFHFRHVVVPPFNPDETRTFLREVEFSGDRADLLKSATRLHRLSAGHPATLAALVAELRVRTYDLRTAEGLRLLALHARITRVEDELGHYEEAGRRKPAEPPPRGI